MRAPVSPHSHRHLLFSVTFIIAIVTDMKSYLPVVLASISSHESWTSFYVLLATCLSSLGRHLFKSSTHSDFSCLSYYWFFRVLYIFWIEVFIKYMICEYFLPFFLWVFSLSWWCLFNHRSFHLWSPIYPFFSSMDPAFWCCI